MEFRIMKAQCAVFKTNCVVWLQVSKQLHIFTVSTQFLDRAFKHSLPGIS